MALDLIDMLERARPGFLCEGVCNSMMEMIERWFHSRERKGEETKQQLALLFRSREGKSSY